MTTSEFKFQDEEPSAAWRNMAKTFREMFVALVHEGFTERQALEMIGHAMRAAVSGGKTE